MLPFFLGLVRRRSYEQDSGLKRAWNQCHGRVWYRRYISEVQVAENVCTCVANCHVAIGNFINAGRQYEADSSIFIDDASWAVRVVVVDAADFIVTHKVK